MVIEVDFPYFSSETLCQSSVYISGIRDILFRILPENALKEREKFKNFIEASLPYISWENLESDSFSFSILLFAPFRKGSSTFFYDMISRWLAPSDPLDIRLFFASDFELADFNGKYSVSEIVVVLKSRMQKEEVLKNKAMIETELRLGILSDYHANRILKFKGLSVDRKTAMVQEKITSLMKTHSKDFGQSIFSDMQHFLVTCRDEFKMSRDYHHISRIISVLYLIRKLLKQKIKNDSSNRHVIVKFLKTQIKEENASRSVLGVLIGLNFLKEHEVFGKEHLLKSIQRTIPNVKIVPNSYFVKRNQKESFQTIYLEVEKEKKDFHFEEIQKLRYNLPVSIKMHIERLIHPIFMPRNEEEIVKNILVLSRQLKYVHDIPQVIISFDHQTGSGLSFTVICLRVLKPGSLSIQQLLKKTETQYKFQPERIKRIGLLRRKYIKEASVFRVLVNGKVFLREDHSVDLNKARQSVLEDLMNIFQDVRDYNGGMIFKQNESYRNLIHSLGDVGKKNSLLLEQFFYSIIPIETTVIYQDALKHLFLMLLNAIRREEAQIKKTQDYIFKMDGKAIYIVMPVYTVAVKRKINEKIEEFKLFSSDFLSFSLQTHDMSFMGFGYFTEDSNKQKSFLKIIADGVKPPHLGEGI